MTQITLKGSPIHTNGSLPALGTKAPDFSLTAKDLSDVTLKTFAGKKKILNIFPSIDTPTCAMSVRKFNELATKNPNTVVLCISADLPFASARFCGAEGLEKVHTLSTFRSAFANDYGIQITDSVLKGLCARAVVVIDTDDRILYTEQVPEIAQEPNYDKALSALLFTPPAPKACSCCG